MLSSPCGWLEVCFVKHLEKRLTSLRHSKAVGNVSIVLWPWRTDWDDMPENSSVWCLEDVGGLLLGPNNHSFQDLLLLVEGISNANLSCCDLEWCSNFLQSNVKQLTPLSWGSEKNNFCCQKIPQKTWSTGRTSDITCSQIPSEKTIDYLPGELTEYPSPTLLSGWFWIVSFLWGRWG